MECFHVDRDCKWMGRHVERNLLTRDPDYANEMGLWVGVDFKAARAGLNYLFVG